MSEQALEQQEVNVTVHVQGTVLTEAYLKDFIMEAAREYRDREALRQHLIGLTYPEIAAWMKFESATAAHEAAQRALAAFGDYVDEFFLWHGIFGRAWDIRGPRELP